MRTPARPEANGSRRYLVLQVAPMVVRLSAGKGMARHGLSPHDWMHCGHLLHRIYIPQVGSAVTDFLPLNILISSYFFVMDNSCSFSQNCVSILKYAPPLLTKGD